jgi:hypothetical protein
VITISKSSYEKSLGPINYELKDAQLHVTWQKYLREDTCFFVPHDKSLSGEVLERREVNRGCILPVQLGKTAL